MKNKLFLFVAALSAPLFVSPKPTQAQVMAYNYPMVPPTYTIYLYINGIPTDVTSLATWSDGHVYDLEYNHLGTVIDGWIVNEAEQVVGFIVIEEGGNS